MRRRSFAAPLLLLVIGGLFLWRNLHPEAPIFDLVATYWPFLLVAWGVIRLLEVVVWHNARYSGLTGGEIVLVVLVCMAGAGLFEVHRHGIRLTPALFGEQFEFPVEVSSPAAGVKRIVFDNPRGTIHVTGGDAAQIAITGHKLVRAYTREDADRTDKQTPIEAVPQGDRLLITSHQDRAPADQRVSNDLDITVPRGIAIEAHSDNTDYEISQINGSVEVRSSRGDVRLSRIGGNVRLDVGRSATISAEDIQGTVDLQGRGSDVEVQNVSGPVNVSGAFVGSLEFKNLSGPLRFQGERNTEVRVNAVPGSINMDLGEFTAKSVVGPVRLVTASRDIHLEDFTESLELETQRGDVELQPGRVPLPKIDARSGSGEINLVLPEKANFQLEATVERGEATNDYGPQIEVQNEGRMSILKGTVGNGPMIRISTNRGSVSVRKEGSAPNRIAEPPKAPKIPPVPSVPAVPAVPAPPANLKDSEVKL